MRFHVVSDLHLEAQDSVRLAGGDVLIVAGDLCNAAAFEAPPELIHAAKQRDRVKRFADVARAKYAHVVMIAGNHEHYEGVFEDSIPILRRHLPGFTILDDETVEIGGYVVFGGTLWSDFEGRDPAAMEACRRGMGDYFFVTSRARAEAAAAAAEVAGTGPTGGAATSRRRSSREGRLLPADTLAAHDRCLARLGAAAVEAGRRPLIVVTHHAPSRSGVNPRYSGNGLDGAYVSALDALVEKLRNCPVWVHGHTHIRKRYEIGQTKVIVNCRGFVEREGGPRIYDTSAGFEL